MIIFWKYSALLILGAGVFLLTACGATYRAKPLPFKAPSAYPNAMKVAGAVVGAKAFVDRREAAQAFGFDIRGAGMLPVQVVFDNQGPHTLEINGAQSFLEDKEGNLWPILSAETAYERATRFVRTKEIFKEGAYSGVLGAAAGAVIGAAVGVVSGENVAEAAGKGAAVGAATGGTLGGIKAYGSGDARRRVIDDLRQKSLQARSVESKSLAFGFLFFPGEATSAERLRIRVEEADTGAAHTLILNL